MGALWDEWFTPQDAETIRFKVQKIVRSGKSRGADALDVQQRLAIRTWKAMQRHNPAKGTRGTFLKTVLDNESAKIIEHDIAAKRDWRRERPIEHAGQALVANGKDARIDTERRLDVAEAIAKLPPDLQEVARQLMAGGVAGVVRATGLTRQQVRTCVERIARHFEACSLQADF